MRLLIFGPQGAGKGTQSARIAEKFGVEAIATGDMFRWAISEGTKVGHRAREYVENGLLVPDELTIEVVEERLAAKDFDDFLLDGFPRNLFQAEALEDMLSSRNAGLDAAVVLEVPDQVSIERITRRRVCVQCGHNYHDSAPPRRDSICDRCGGRVERRSDDNEEGVRRRLSIYHEQTEPLKMYYEGRGVLLPIDGVGTPDEVFARIAERLG